MKLQELTIKNFKVFPKKTSIDFSSDNKNNKKNIILIGGINGAGKTTLIEAVKLCLYGRKELGWNKKKLFELISEQQKSKGDYELYFKVSFETEEGKDITITRKWDTKGADLEPNYKDLEQQPLVLEKDGRKRKVLNEREWNKFLDSKIPGGVSNFFFFDAEKISEFAETGVKSSLRNSIETILGLSTLRNLSKDLKSVKQRFRDKEEITDEQFKKEQAEKKVLEEKINKNSEQINEIEEEIKTLKEEKEQKIKRFEELFGEGPKGSNEYTNLERRKTKLQNKITNIEDKISEYVKEVFPFALLGRFFPKIKAQIEKEEELKKQKAVQEEKQEIANRIVKNLFQDKCPIGGEPVNKQERENLLKSITEIIIRDEVQNIEKSNAVLDLSRGQKNKLLGQISEIKKRSGKDLLPLIKRKREAEQELEKTKERIESLEQKKDEEEFNKLRKEISNLDDNLGSKKEKRRHIEDKNKKIKKELKKLNSKLEKLQDKLDESRKAKKSIELTKKIESIIESYIKQLRERKLSKLEENIFEMFQKLASKSELYSEISIDRDSYKVDIIDNSGNKKRKANLSEGEKQIYAISLLWGLAKTSAYNLPVIIDTPLARFDKSHRDNIVENYFPQAGNQVILLSTDTEVDKEYYEKLQPHINKAFHLNFNKNKKWTTIEKNYFW